jgi:hypothetical protein
LQHNEITGHAVNVTSSPVTYKVAERVSRHLRQPDGSVRNLSRQEYVEYTVGPGEVVDVGGLAMPRAENAGNNNGVLTVIEARSRGAIVPLWKPKAQTYREQMRAREEAQAKSRARRAEAAAAAERTVRAGLAKRKLTAAQVELCWMAHSDRVVVGEDDQTPRVEWPDGDGVESLPLDKGLDKMAAAIRAAMTTSSKGSSK